MCNTFQTGIRAPYYGELKSTQNKEAWRLWMSRHEELPLLEPIELEDQQPDQSDPTDLLDFSNKFWGMLELLTDRERLVIESRFKEEMTLGEVGEALLVGKERIRQIEAKALRKLQHPSRMMSLGVSTDEVHHMLCRFNGYRLYRSKMKISVLSGSIVKPPEEFYSVYKMSLPKVYSQALADELFVEFQYRFQKEFNINMLSMAMCELFNTVEQYIFVTEKDSFNARCCDELLEKMLVKKNVKYEKNLYSETVNS